MKKNWTFADVLDFDFFLSSDQELIDNGLDDTPAERDRAIYQQVKTSCKQESSSVDRACLLRQWLSCRRETFRRQTGESSVLPGGLFQELTRIFAWTIFFLTLFIGWGGAFSFLSYSGTTPVNVSFYLLLFVGSQLFLFLALLVSCIVRRLTGGGSLPLVYTLLHKGILQLAVKLGRLPSVTDAHRWFAGLSGRLKRRQRNYGLLSALPFFFLLQLGGIGFNLGVLAATLIKVIGTDIAFGWQSTLQLGSESVYRLVESIALPWSWFLPAGVGYPDPAQIKGSQMVLKDGIYHLTTGDLVSWWPFLCLAVAVYGLLPRICLLLAGWLTHRSLLSRLEFNTALQRQLLHRMLTPRLSTESNRENMPARDEEQDDPVEEIVEPQGDGQILALIPDELFDDGVEQQLAELVRNRLGLQVERYLRINQDGVDELQELTGLEQKDLINIDSLLLLQEAWQPPIEEFFFFLRRVRELVGEKVLLSIVFIGKPTAKTIFTGVREQDYRIWQKKIDVLGDPYLQCIRLVVS